MSKKVFGTDGVRAKTNTGPMKPDCILKLAQAVGREFLKEKDRHLVVIGKDTRLSGYMIEPALTSGFISIGMNVVLVGPMPTPAVSMLTRSLRADLGVMISASHNPYQDNGIKFFNADGHKLSDSIELKIEKNMEENMDPYLASPHSLGRATRLDDAPGRYIEYVKNTFPRGMRLEGLRIVVDCAHGAAYKIAPEVLWELGADVLTIGDTPDGLNINKGCGATDCDLLRKTVVEQGADIGIALDGDADRVIICDEDGEIVDGDHIMALIAYAWHKENRLKGGSLVSTVMSNLGLERYLKDHGIDLIRTQVGDRYVAEHMRLNGFNVGGEQSGHIILSDYVQTGDGLVAALQVLAIMIKHEYKASEVSKLFDPLPQILKNILIEGTNPENSKEKIQKILDSEGFKKQLKLVENKLGKRGRVLIRPSGTEPILRVMGEADDKALLDEVIQELVHCIENQKTVA